MGDVARYFWVEELNSRQVALSVPTGAAGYVLDPSCIVFDTFCTTKVRLFSTVVPGIIVGSNSLSKVLRFSNAFIEYRRALLS